MISLLLISHHVIDGTSNKNSLILIIQKLENDPFMNASFINKKD